MNESSRHQREAVMEAVRAALAGLDARTPLPEYDPSIVVAERYLGGGSRWADFAANFASVNGRAMTGVDELIAFLKEYGYGQGFCDPALRAEVGSPLERAGIPVAYHFERGRHNDYSFGITRASAAIAETGTLILDDFNTVDRLAALAPWVHVAVLSEEAILRTIPDAIAALGDSPNTVWVTGPSKTGDIEGILVEGVHGPGEQVCLLSKGLLAQHRG